MSPVISTSPSGPPTSEAILDSISVEELRNLNEAVATLKGERLLEDEIQELKEDREEYRGVSVQCKCIALCDVSVMWGTGCC